VPFVEKNVAADRQAAMEMFQASGQQGVPQIKIDGEIVVGFDQPRLVQLLQQARVQARPKLGAAVADVASLSRAGSQAAKHPGIPASGAYVGRVRAGTPAERAGLRRGDVITHLGGQPIILADDLFRLVSQVPEGRNVALRYVRDGRQRETVIRL
jgi:S1-C subfamily serine protease